MTKKSEWEEMIKRAAVKAKEKELHEKRTLRKFVDSLKTVLTMELLVGVFAAFSLYIFFGWNDLFKVLLSWTIGITMVSTVVTLMVDRYKKLIHLR
ncbi:hypothetical protein GF361_02035 [Candidatus Woesearchaeota archaeon]|nr:hypothetical protein [Candidatus Woesearchaeota archaeon]